MICAAILAATLLATATASPENPGDIQSAASSMSTAKSTWRTTVETDAVYKNRRKQISVLITHLEARYHSAKGYSSDPEAERSRVEMETMRKKNESTNETIKELRDRAATDRLVAEISRSEVEKMYTERGLARDESYDREISAYRDRILSVNRIYAQDIWPTEEKYAEGIELYADTLNKILDRCSGHTCDRNVVADLVERYLQDAAKILENG